MGRWGEGMGEWGWNGGERHSQPVLEDAQVMVMARQGSVIFRASPHKWNSISSYISQRAG